MLTLFNLFFIFILVVIDGYLIKSLLDSRNSFRKRLDQLEDHRISQNRHINSVRQDIDTLMFQIKEIKDNSHDIHNLSSDLDRTIGTIDQIQEKVSEINVTLENIINELNTRK